MNNQDHFNRHNKKTVNISTIGHIDHGKTTLTSAITKITAQKYGTEYKKYDQIDSAKEEKDRGITINAAHVHYQTEHRLCIHVDCPGHEDYIKNMIVGSSEIDIAILVVSVTHGIMPQTKEHVLLISRIGVPSLIVFLNKIDKLDPTNEDDLMIIELVEEDIRELAAKYGYKDINIIRGSAQQAIEQKPNTNKYGEDSINKLLHFINTLEVRERNLDASFLMQVEGKCTITGRGTVAVGRIIQGKIVKGKEIEIVGGIKSIKTIATSIEMFKKTVDEAGPADDVGILLRGIEKHQINRGMVIAAPGFAKSSNKIICELYVLTADEGGRKTGFGVKYSPQLYIRSLDVTGQFMTIYDTSDTKICIALPGDTIVAELHLQRKVPIDKDIKIIFRESGKTIAGGRIKTILE